MARDLGLRLAQSEAKTGMKSMAADCQDAVGLDFRELWDSKGEAGSVCVAVLTPTQHSYAWLLCGLES